MAPTQKVITFPRSSTATGSSTTFKPTEPVTSSEESDFTTEEGFTTPVFNPPSIFTTDVPTTAIPTTNNPFPKIPSLTDGGKNNETQILAGSIAAAVAFVALVIIIACRLKSRGRDEEPEAAEEIEMEGVAVVAQEEESQEDRNLMEHLVAINVIRSGYSDDKKKYITEIAKQLIAIGFNKTDENYAHIIRTVSLLVKNNMEQKHGLNGGNFEEVFHDTLKEICYNAESLKLSIRDYNEISGFEKLTLKKQAVLYTSPSKVGAVSQSPSGEESKPQYHDKPSGSRFVAYSEPNIPLSEMELSRAVGEFFRNAGRPTIIFPPAPPIPVTSPVFLDPSEVVETRFSEEEEMYDERRPTSTSSAQKGHSPKHSGASSVKEGSQSEGRGERVSSEDIRFAREYAKVQGRPSSQGGARPLTQSGSRPSSQGGARPSGGSLRSSIAASIKSRAEDNLLRRRVSTASSVVSEAPSEFVDLMSGSHSERPDRSPSKGAGPRAFFGVDPKEEHKHRQ